MFKMAAYLTLSKTKKSKCSWGLGKLPMTKLRQEATQRYGTLSGTCVLLSVSVQGIK
jgi:hypothetical protein